MLYYVSLLLLAVVVLVLRNLEHSRLGRAWIAIREDELAATCMGINAPRAKLASFAISAGLAGLAGCLYATKLTTTADPNAYDFNRSIIMLCCVILGGLGSIRGTILGVFLLLGFDNIISPQLDSWIQNSEINQRVPHWIRSITSEDSTLPQMFERLLTFSNWKLMIFGLALVLMMRLRPKGYCRRFECNTNCTVNELILMQNPPPLLNVRQLTMRFGGLTAVCRVDLQIDPGQIFSVIGPNGAGKTTVFNAITGIYQPTEGKIEFGGRQLARPIGWRVIVMAGLVGLFTAIALVAITANVDGLWHATIFRNYDVAKHKFDYRRGVARSMGISRR